MSLPLSVIYQLMDAKGLKDWSDNILRVNLSIASSAPASQEVSDSLVDSVTPPDPWEFLDYEYEDDDEYDEDDESIILLEQLYPDDFKHITRV